MPKSDCGYEERGGLHNYILIGLQDLEKRDPAAMSEVPENLFNKRITKVFFCEECDLFWQGFFTFIKTNGKYQLSEDTLGYFSDEALRYLGVKQCQREIED